MTIAVCCTLADGVILGTDSAITVTGVVQTPRGPQGGILKVYNEAEKVFGLHSDGDRHSRLSVGLVTYGLATLGNRTIESYVREFEIEHPATKLRSLTMEEVCARLHTFFHKRYVDVLGQLAQQQGKKLEDFPLEQRMLGMFVGGFSPKEPLPEAWEVHVHEEGAARLKQVRKPGDFGSNWGGQFDGVLRFHKGYDPALIEAVLDALAAEFKMVDVTNAAQMDKVSTIVNKTLAKFEYKVPFAAMPLQEGIDYTTFLLDMMILQHRFVVGAPTCGGTVRIAVVQKHEGFQWIAGKEFKVKGSRYA